MKRNRSTARILACILSLLLVPGVSTPGAAADYAPYGVTLPPEAAIHCSESAIEAVEPESLAQMVEMVKYRIQPQAVELLRTHFPVFEEAARSNQLGTQIGLSFIYDDSFGEGNASAQWSYNEDEYGSSRMKYRIEVNARALVETDADGNALIDPVSGKARLTTDEETLTIFDWTITHEMLHIFMADYNRCGMAASNDPALFYLDAYATEEDAEALEAAAAALSFPDWFREGCATAVENQYAYRIADYTDLCLDGGGDDDGWFSPQILRNALTGQQHNMLRDVYILGYLATLYLAELAENSEARTAWVSGADGVTVFDSDALRAGLNTILRLLHEGLTLDDVIYNFSDGRFLDAADFENRFLVGDEDSAVFCSELLNYFRQLSLDPGREYLPNGSILFPFDTDYETAIDRTADAASDLYRIVDSGDYVTSTADLSGVSDAGTSLTLRAVRNASESGWVSVYNDIAA